MEYGGQGNKPKNIWGMAPRTPEEFYKLKEAEAGLTEMLNGGGGRFSVGQSEGYQGRIGADTSNIPPSMRGLYENSAPSLESIQGAYDANMATGRYTHQEIMDNFNAQAARDDKFWADGFAKDPNFSQTLHDKSQAMMGTDANQASIAAHQKNIGALAASRGAFNQAPKAGDWSPGGTVKAAKTNSPGFGNVRTSFAAPKFTAKAAAPLNPRTGRSYSSGRGW